MPETMKSVSVSRRMGERIAAAADESGMSMGDVVEAACDNLPTDPAEVAALADRVWTNMPAGTRTVRGASASAGAALYAASTLLEPMPEK